MYRSTRSNVACPVKSAMAVSGRLADAMLCMSCLHSLCRYITHMGPLQLAVNHVHKFRIACALRLSRASWCLQGKKIRPSQKPLPDLPSNAQYVFHDNLCYDWGTFGWGLSSAVSDISSYSYFVFLNSSVRGPHLPAYWPVSFFLDCHPSLSLPIYHNKFPHE